MQVLDFIKYKFQAGNAHGLHSPFVYDLYTQAIEPNKKYYIFDKIEEKRQQLLRNDTKIKVTDLGAGSRKNNSESRSIKSIAKTSLCSERTGAFLFELISRYKYKNILELGTSLGISTLYLSTAAKDISTVTIEGSKSISVEAQNIFNEFPNTNITSLTGNIDDLLESAIKKLPQLDVVYFDANHKFDPTIDYFERCKKFAHENTLFIFDDIYWSKEMKKAWFTIIKDEAIGISVDLFHIGLCFFRQKQPKQHFKLQYETHE
ncbi:O-methyltransferase [Flammeovirga kamogawensis]|uniref:Class I SAM-dependent methyltransferase n=1 Tax=Flammeovirga kamogawensis TaxID=373891 RepID=A0ABX8GZ76_9BACT|nr:class I SAM-dependent methyltransferase [Flammeovirga kamogawensis]MBB6460895.1 putative O-methyltransferase YrrM [Flammeovirga kamogawensis]QWG08240.1 class I SAM-dependent methyltransferase [Flammeovirga kamogawensis]TRX70043.1 class I SAM-dependent methyltransferase [Flammeovirga kamogawensis]